MTLTATDPPVDDVGIPLGHDPACEYWLRQRARDLSVPFFEEVRHRATCARCMEYAEWVAELVRSSSYVIPHV